jgi:transcriptional regulator with XRE-family HTH domain
MQIKKVIEGHGKSWASVAKDMGKTSSAIIQIADGNPTVGKLKQLAGVIGCHWLDFFQDELEAEGLQVVKSEQQGPAPQPQEKAAEEKHDDLPFSRPDGGQQPTATMQQAVICPHCHQALVFNIAAYEQK